MHSLMCVLCLVMGHQATTAAIVSLLRPSGLTSPPSTQHTLATPSSLTITNPSHFSLTTPSSLTLTTLSPLILMTTYPLKLATSSPVTFTTASPLTLTTASSFQYPLLLPRAKRVQPSSERLSSGRLSDLPPPSGRFPGLLPPSERSPGLFRISGRFPGLFPPSGRSPGLFPPSGRRSPGLSSPLGLSQGSISEAAVFQNNPPSAQSSSRSMLQTANWRGIQAQPTYTQHPSISSTLQQIYDPRRRNNVNNLMCAEERNLPHSADCQHLRIHPSGLRNGSFTREREAVIITSLFTGKALAKSHSIASLTKTVKPYVAEAFQVVNSSSNPPPTIWKTLSSNNIPSAPCKDSTICQDPSECLEMAQLECDNANSDLEIPWSWKNASFIMPNDDGGLQNMSLSPCPSQTNISLTELSGCSSSGTYRAPTAASLVASEWARIVGFSLIFVVGVVGNVLVVVTLLHHRNLRTVTNVFLLNLAVSDLLLGVFCMPFTLVGSLLQDFVFGAIMCRLIPYMQAVSVSVSVWTLVAISLERFYAICQPLRSRRWQTPAHSYRVIAGVWAASLLIMTPIAALSTLMPVRGDPGRHKCREVWPSLAVERTFTVMLTATLLLVPLVVMAAAYLRVVRTLWLGAQLRAQPGAPPRAASKVSKAVVVQHCASNTAPPPPPLNARISVRFRRIPPPSPGSHSPSGGKDSVLSLLQNPRQRRQDKSFNGDLETVSTTPGEPEGYAGESRAELPVGQKTSKKSRWRNDEDVRDDGTCWRPLRSSHTERSLMAKRRVVRMLFVLVAEFFICWSPLFIVNLLSLYIPRQVYAALGSFGVSLVQLLAYLSSCCNPITYCFMNANFIQSFRQTFGCPRRRPSYSFRSGYESSFRSAGAFTHTHLRVNADQPITMTQLTPNQRCPSIRHSPRTPMRHSQGHLALSCVQGPAPRTHSTSFTNKLLTNGATPASQTRSSSL